MPATKTWGVYTATNRQTGSVITLVDNRDESFEEMGEGRDPELDKQLRKDGSWATVCDTHGSYVLHASRSLAYGSFTQPWEWCEDCQAGMDFEKMGTQDDKYVGPVS